MVNNRKKLIFVGIAVDCILARVYWSDYNGHKIKSSSFKGKNVTTLIDTSKFSIFVLLMRKKRRKTCPLEHSQRPTAKQLQIHGVMGESPPPPRKRKNYIGH